MFLLAIAVALPVGVTSPASADDWGYFANGGTHPDGASHSWCYGVEVDGSVNADIFANVQSAEYESLQAQTNALAPYISNCVYTGGSETDVVWLSRNLSGSSRGYNSCQAFHANGTCDQNYSALDLAQIAAGGSPVEVNETKTACHELGHTVGLSHHNAGTQWGCMVKGHVTSELKWRRYVTDHKNHINDWFQ